MSTLLKWMKRAKDTKGESKVRSTGSTPSSMRKRKPAGKKKTNVEIEPAGDKVVPKEETRP